jgi:hypothetical protein
MADFNSAYTGAQIDAAIALAQTAQQPPSEGPFVNGDKTKLDGIAAGAEVNVNADWSAGSGDAQILNKPTTLSGYGITDAASNGAITTSGLTMTTDRILGRSTAGTGAVEELTRPAGDLVGTTATQTFTNKTIGDLKETVFTVSDGASVDLDPINGPIQQWTLGDNRTPTATNFGAGQSMMIMIADGTAFAVTWTTMAVVWVGGSAPTLATSGFTVIELWRVGSTIYGARVGDVA